VLPSPPDLELLAISTGSPAPAVYCLIYIPPNSPDNYIQKNFNFLISLNDHFSNLVLLGDFDFTNINWDSLYSHSPTSANFCDIIFDLNLTQLVNQPTHTASSILDLILTNIPDSIFNLHIHDSHPHLIITLFHLTFSPLQSLAKSVNQLISWIFPRETTWVCVSIWVPLTSHLVFRAKTLNLST